MKKKKIISISLSEEMIVKLKERSEDLKISISSLIELILKNKIKL